MPSPSADWRALESRLVDFAATACRIVRRVPRTSVGEPISEQLARSAVSPAPNYAEAQSAESRRDFIHKMRVCLKELREALVWLKLVERLELVRGEDVAGAIKEADELVAIFTRSVLTAQANAGKRSRNRRGGQDRG